VRLTVDTSSPVPAYEQIRTQIEALVRHGVLQPGTSLPPIRQLAADLGLAPNTVVKAFRELEAAGTIATKGRRGSHVAAKSTLTEEERSRQARAAAHQFLMTIQLLGLDPHQAHALLDAEIADQPRGAAVPDSTDPAQHATLGGDRA
jgi:DNA-binding transcriptional regulator YhcF (GntR family)